jgi:undecaprenyl phosphate-alpha-L-ara4FN deformylase
MPHPVVAIKVDIDTDRGTRLGVPALLALFSELNITATFLFSLGPDNTGRAIKRIFRQGFFSKVVRTNVVGIYGVRTLLNGVLWPGPHIGRRNETIMRAVPNRGHEVGIHCYDHVRWQDGLGSMTRDEVFREFGKARFEFERVFGEAATTAGAAGWQANAYSLAAYDQAGLRYASDVRGKYPFFPCLAGVRYNTLQIPTTLPTLDELLGRSGYMADQLPKRYLSWLDPVEANVLTIHAEIEGGNKLMLFRELLLDLQRLPVQFVRLGDLAETILRNPAMIPTCELLVGQIEGRAGTLAVQKASRAAGVAI